MKKKKFLKQQNVERKRGDGISQFWQAIRSVASWGLKVSAFLAGMAAISLLFITLYSYLLSSPYMQLDRVEITGVEEGLGKELQEACGLNRNLSLLAINVEHVRMQLKKHPWVREAGVEKQFPHTLRIRAEKEEPRALVAGERLSYMNRFGEVFKEVGPGEVVDFPVVTGLSSEPVDREKQLGFSMQVLDFLESQEDPWSLRNLSEIHVRKDGEVTLYFSFLPVAVKLKAQHLSSKMKELRRVVDHLNSTGRMHTVKTIHLHYDEGVVVAFKKG